MSNAAKGLMKDIVQFLREALTEASILWWRFFDWLAVTEWRQIYLTWFVVFMLAAVFQLTDPALLFILISGGLKILAGGKRRAEITAREAVKNADVANLERRLVEAQMATLQAQVEPHFLFNTLALIGQLIETDPAQAARIHQNLIDYLRATLPQMRSAGSGTLGKQVELSRAYLTIMQARMKERLTVKFDVPVHLEPAPFPPMMLLTLIENSIKHGLEPKIEGGHIDITARVVDRQLWVDVLDNGVGFNLHSDEGVGLANIRERLRLLYGDAGQLVIEAPLAGGAYASIRIPYEPMENRV